MERAADGGWAVGRAGDEGPLTPRPTPHSGPRPIPQVEAGAEPSCERGIRRDGQGDATASAQAGERHADRQPVFVSIVTEDDPGDPTGRQRPDGRERVGQAAGVSK